MDCMVNGCMNASMLGDGVEIVARRGKNNFTDNYWICMPCWNFIKESTGTNNQVFRNTTKIVREKIEELLPK